MCDTCTMLALRAKVAELEEKLKRICDHLHFTANNDAELAAIEAANYIKQLEDEHVD